MADMSRDKRESKTMAGAILAIVFGGLAIEGILSVVFGLIFTMPGKWLLRAMHREMEGWWVLLAVVVSIVFWLILLVFGSAALIYQAG